MKTERVMRFPTGQLRISRIVYFTDLIHSDTREISIGVVAEVTLPSLRAIGTALRPSLSEIEMGLMGSIAREILAEPMRGLWPSMEWAFGNSASGQALELLASRYASSISVLMPNPLHVPRQWLLPHDYDALSQLVKDRMRVTLIDEYFNFLFPPRDGTVTDPNLEELLKAA